MSTDANGRKHETSNGQFAVGARAEPEVRLTSPPRLTSSDGVAGYQFPRDVKRRDALTAFDDDEGTYTIGDDLQVRTAGLLTHWWVDSARPMLAQLHRAGFAGQCMAYSGSGHLGDEGNWVLRVELPSGALLTAESREGLGGESSVEISCGWHQAGAPPAGQYKGVDQRALDASVRRVLELHAIESTWVSSVRAVSAKPFDVGSILVRETDNGGMYLALEPHAGRAFSTLVFVDAPRRVARVVEVPRDDHAAHLAAITGTGPGAPAQTAQAMANLGRRMGLGRGAPVANQVHGLLTGALATAGAPDLVWLDANLAAQR
jgi:hypothetical protein